MKQFLIKQVLIFRITVEVMKIGGVESGVNREAHPGAIIAEMQVTVVSNLTPIYSNTNPNIL